MHGLRAGVGLGLLGLFGCTPAAPLGGGTGDVPPQPGCAAGEALLEDGTCRLAGIPPEACAAGFAPDDSAGCEPVVASGCDPGSMAPIGEPSCREVAPCSRGSWGDAPIGPETQFVDAAYRGGSSDGSAASPWTTIQAGVDAAVPSAVVAVAAGQYDESVITFKPVKLWGRCPSQVTLAGSGLASLSFYPGADGSEVHDLAITGPDYGILVAGARDVVIERVWIHDTGGGGFLALPAGSGAPIRAGATLRASLIERSHDTALYASGADVAVEGSVLRDTMPGPNGRGWGAVAEVSEEAGPAAMHLTGTLLSGSTETGIVVSASDAVVEGSVVDDTRLNAQGDYGWGISVEPHWLTGAPSSLVLRGSLVGKSYQGGVVVIDSAAEIEATVVRATEPGVARAFGDGVVAGSRDAAAPAHVAVRQSVVADNLRAGIANFGAVVELVDTAVRCNPVQLNGEQEYFEYDIPFEFVDGGGNVCFCGTSSGVCQVLSSGLEPPVQP